MSDAAPLALEGVSKSLGGRPVLHDVGFDCPAGTITALLGPNGAGKTTTVAVATGLRHPDCGSVRLAGRRVTGAGVRRLFSLVPQDVGFPASVGVAVCLDLVEQQRAPSGFVPPRGQLCDALGITELLGRRVGALSGGQHRRLALVLGLLRAPGLLIMDEATTNLDETSRATTWRLIRDYAAAGGAALVTTHILADIDAHADRVVALAGGRVVLTCPLAQARSRLGGTQVSVELDALEVSRTSSLVAALGHGPADRFGATGLRWRTPAPLALVAALAEIAPDARELEVRPVPLSAVLDSLTTSEEARR